MLLHILLALALVSIMSAMPMEEADQDIIERSPRQISQLPLLPPSPKNLEKAEAVLLAGSLLNKLDKEAGEKVKSRETDDNLEEEYLDEIQDEMEERSIDKEEEEAEEEEENATLEERNARKRVQKFRKYLKKFEKGKKSKNVAGKEVREYMYIGKGGYERALKHFQKFKPQNLRINKGKLTGFVGKNKKVRVSLKKSSSVGRPTITIVGKKRVYKLRY